MPVRRVLACEDTIAAVSYLFGVVFLAGGVAMTLYRRGFIGQLRSIMLSTGQADAGAGYNRKMEWMVAGIGVMFGLAGVLMLVGALDLISK